jgi:molybdopterin biosynthesis enzyme
MPPRVSAYPMVQVGEALETILAQAQPLGRETVEFGRARNRILAEDVFADDDLPGLPRSSVDGYAVTSSDAATELEVLEEVTAGRLAQAQVRPGTTVRIMTGGTLPRGADAVVMVEDVDESNGRAVLQRRPRTGENIHPPGMDLTRAQRVLVAGSRLG